MELLENNILARQPKNTIVARSKQTNDAQTKLKPARRSKLTFGDHDNFHPRFSPDGEWIAFISNRGGLPQLWLLETYGGAQKKMAMSPLRWKRPMGRVNVRVRDAQSGKLTAARIYGLAPDGKFYAPAGSYSRFAYPRMARRTAQHAFHTEGKFPAID